MMRIGSALTLLRGMALIGMWALALASVGQVPITTGSYFQDFGTTDVTSWTNNVTYLGWYNSTGTLASHLNITNTAPTNSGGFYTYECNSNNNQKIGSRASGGTGLSNIRYGVVFRNTTGYPIYSIQVSYTGYQLSLAENGSVVNTITFDFVTSTTQPAITALATGSVPPLNFTQTMNSTIVGSSQIRGYPCTQSRDISACVTFSTPLPNNSYLLLRWTDIDDTNNDHHMAIDDVQVDFGMTSTACAVLLPIELLYFEAEPERNDVRLHWATASEKNNERFIVHRGEDPFTMRPIQQQAGAGHSMQVIEYGSLDHEPLPGVSYYRLQQIDTDGTDSWSEVVAVRREASDVNLLAYPNPSAYGRYTLRMATDAFEFEVFDTSGRSLQIGQGTAGLGHIDLSDRPTGTYILRCTGAERVQTLLLQKAPSQ